MDAYKQMHERLHAWLEAPVNGADRLAQRRELREATVRLVRENVYDDSHSNLADELSEALVYGRPAPDWDSDGGKALLDCILEQGFGLSYADLEDPECYKSVAEWLMSEVGFDATIPTRC